MSKLQTSIIAYEKITAPTTTYYTDRRFLGSSTNRRKDFGNNRWQRNDRNDQRMDPKKGLCFVCGKPDCRPYKHTPEERQRSRENFKHNNRDNFKGFNSSNTRKNARFEDRLDQHIAEIEERDIELMNNTDNELEEAFNNLQIDQHAYRNGEDEINDPPEEAQAMLTSVGEATDPLKLAKQLSEQALIHNIGAHASSYILGDKYGSKDFIDIMIDTGASKASTAGEEQFHAMQRSLPVELNKRTAGSVTVQFGIGTAPSIGSIDLQLPIGTVRFHVVKASTPFLLCLHDMDRRKAYFNNVSNRLIFPGGETPVVRRFGHPFLLLANIQSIDVYIEESLLCNPCYLTETELRRLHRRFGHPAVDRLHKILARSGHEDIDMSMLEHLTKFCHHCQVHGKSPGRFKFTLRDEDNSMFNYNLIIDVMYINNIPVLHVVDEATRMNAARWLSGMSSRETWDVLRACWIDTYLGPPDLLTTDAGTNFVSREFKLYAGELGIRVKTVPVEAHNSIGVVERYHAPLKRAYSIISKELPDLPRDMALQMAVKAINDSAGPNGLVPTLLVFGAYPRMVESDPPHPTVDQRGKAVRKAMIDISKMRAERQVADALNMRNGPSTTAIHGLPMNSDVLVWRESDTHHCRL